ncbi:MAG: T9SS type A sorting domain-containing protein, partial [Flavobacteriales bacterium]|nr:T9SS type A sorting domain-containing protein [Flavobacteriales bacterium]
GASFKDVLGGSVPCVSSSINELESQRNFTVYPNPANDVITISGLANNNEVVTVYDLTGRIVISKKMSDNQLDVSQLKTGFYMITISGKSHSLEIVK